jgi:hypothetical protein
VAFLLVGCALGVGYVLTGSVPQPELELPARVKVSWSRSGDLVASPARKQIAQAKLKPGRGGGKLRGGLSLRNPTRIPLTTSPRALGKPGPLDDLLVVRIATADGPVFEGPLRLLRGSQATPFTVPAGRTARVKIRAWLPGPAPARRWTDRVARVRLEWRTAATGA